MALGCGAPRCAWILAGQILTGIRGAASERHIICSSPSADIEDQAIAHGEPCHCPPSLGACREDDGT